jgi:hypothetical protein
VVIFAEPNGFQDRPAIQEHMEKHAQEVWGEKPVPKKWIQDKLGKLYAELVRKGIWPPKAN